MKIIFSQMTGVLVLILLFIGADILTDTYTHQIGQFIESYGTWGKFLFIALAMTAVVIPVWSNIFLLPFGTMTWGPFLTALFCILGWWVGSLISFYIARAYKEWLLIKYPSLQKYEFIDSLIPEKHVSLSLIFLRMTMPVDILSYSLGLFSKRITWQQNAITTLIGITPFAFMFSYIGVFKTSTQVVIFVITFSLFVLFVYIRKRKATTF